MYIGQMGPEKNSYDIDYNNYNYYYMIEIAITRHRKITFNSVIQFKYIR